VNELKEISKIVTVNRTRRINFIFDKSEKSVVDFFQASKAIASGKVSTNEEFASFVSAEKNSIKFRVYKHRLMDRLLNTMLIIDLSKEIPTAYSQAVKACNRNRYCIDLLLMFSARHTGAALAKKTLKLALEFELYETVFFCAKVLRKHESYLGNLEGYENFKKLADDCYDRMYADDKTAEFIEEVYANQANTNIYPPDVIEKAKHNLKITRALFNQFPLYQVGLKHYRLQALCEELKHDYAAALKTWVQFEGFVEEYKHFEHNVRLGESALQQMHCYLCLGDFEHGRECALKCETLFALHSNNWFIYKETFFLLCMHSRNYGEAEKTLNLITSISHFKLLNRNRQEQWKIFEAYCHIINRAGFPGVAGDYTKQNRFRLSKFLNDIPIYNKDKEGFNTSILIVQIMTLLLDQKFLKLPDKVEALKRYANRYFKKETVYKSHTFMKMIIIADKCSYDKALTLEKTRDMESELNTEGYTHVSSYDGLEIVPYIDLWKIVISSLQ